MSSELSSSDKIGFITATGDYRKVERGLKRLWNDPDGKAENTKYKLIKSSGKGFYDRSAEAIYLEKKTKHYF